MHILNDFIFSVEWSSWYVYRWILYQSEGWVGWALEFCFHCFGRRKSIFSVSICCYNFYCFYYYLNNGLMQINTNAMNSTLWEVKAHILDFNKYAMFRFQEIISKFTENWDKYYQQNISLVSWSIFPSQQEAIVSFVDFF